MITSTLTADGQRHVLLTRTLYITASSLFLRDQPLGRHETSEKIGHRFRRATWVYERENTRRVKEVRHHPDCLDRSVREQGVISFRLDLLLFE
jgi:hypothetical protein